MADAGQAYIQATLRGTPCWIELLADAVLEDDKERWNQFKRPVVRLVMALYGHSDAGTFWERHCDESVHSMGFQPVGEEWPSVYTHLELQVVLVVYVDDCKMAGPKDNNWCGNRVPANGYETPSCQAGEIRKELIRSCLWTTRTSCSKCAPENIILR